MRRNSAPAASPAFSDRGFPSKPATKPDVQSQSPMSAIGMPKAGAKRRPEPPLFKSVRTRAPDIGKPLQTHPPPPAFHARSNASEFARHPWTDAPRATQSANPHPRATPSPPSAPFACRSHKTPNTCPKISTKGTLTSTLSRYTRNICGNEKGTFDVNIRAPMSVMYRICKMHSAPTKKRTSTSA